MNDLELTPKIAYLAGLFDGEGCIRIARVNAARRATYNLDLTLSSTDPRPLEMVVEWFGGQIYTDYSTINQYGRKTCHNWKVGGQKALVFLSTLRPFLIIKGEEADIALRFQQHLLDYQRQHGITGRISKDSLDFRVSMYQKLSGLKKVVHILNNENSENSVDLLTGNAEDNTEPSPQSGKV